MTLTPRQVRLLQSSWAAVAPNSEQVAAQFYGRLFALDPTTRALFTGDMVEQGRKLIDLITIVINGLEYLDELLPVLVDLGRRHAAYGVTERMYGTVGEALLWRLGKGWRGVHGGSRGGLGDDLRLASGNYEVGGVCARGLRRVVGRGSRGASPAANGAARILVRRRITRYDGGLRSPRRVADARAMQIVIILLVIVLVVVGALFGYQQQKKRREALRLLADRMGWQFRADSDHDHDDEYAQFGIFRQGHSRYAYNTLEGPVDIHGVNWPVKMGDFHYQVTSHNGKSSTTHTYRFSYALLRLPYRRIPELLIRREGMFDALKNLFGFDDIDFESAEFSRRFCVKSPDRRFAYDVIHPRMIEFLLEYEPPTIDIEAGSCLLADGKRTWTPEQFRATIDWAEHFFELWPAHVTAQLQPEV